MDVSTWSSRDLELSKGIKRSGCESIYTYSTCTVHVPYQEKRALICFFSQTGSVSVHVLPYTTLGIGVSSVIHRGYMLLLDHLKVQLSINP